MHSRTTSISITFRSAFIVPGVEAPQKPGTYRVDHDEEPIDSNTRLAWRRAASFIHLPAIGTPAARAQLVAIAPGELEAIVDLDRRTT